MSYFLWIEDFENAAKDIVTEVFGDIGLDLNQFFDDKYQLRKNLTSKGIYVELSFQDGLYFIQENLRKIDYIILDMDLLPYLEDESINPEVLALLEKYHDYKNLEENTLDQQRQLFKRVCAELKKIAGFYLYTELVVEQGFPKNHILFYSSNGGNAKAIQDIFNSAKLQLPAIYEKSDRRVQEWVTSCYENTYSRLRRGIIEACQHLIKLKEKLRYDRFSIDNKKPSFIDIGDYLYLLENFLPLCEPVNKAALYKLFIRTLAHEWGPVKAQKINDEQTTLAFSWVMKTTRNWIEHNSTAIFNNLTEQDVAYLFICNMRAIFDLGDQPKEYEKNLFLLFNKSEESKAYKESELNVRTKRIPLVKNYVSYFNETETSAIHVHNMLNDMQNNKEILKEKGDVFFVTGLYQLFWFLTSRYINKKDVAQENINNQNQVFISRYYSFEFFDYTQSDFLLKFSSHIYNRSFP